MLEQPRRASFADPETEFEIVTSDSPVSVDGYALGEPTGEVKCDACEAILEGCIDEIEHDADCPQRNVHSRRWFEIHGRD